MIPVKEEFFDNKIENTPNIRDYYLRLKMIKNK